MLRKLLTAGLLALALHGQAQITQPARVEFDAKEDVESVRPFTIGEDGVIAVLEKDDNDGYDVIHYDKGLKEKKKFSFSIAKGQHHINSYKHETDVYLLFHDYKKGDFTIVHIDGKAGSATKASGEVLGKTSLSGIAVLNNKVWLSGRLKKSAFLTIFDMGSKKNQIVNLPQPAKADMSLALRAHPASKEVHAIINTCTKSDCNLSLMRFDNNGSTKGSTQPISNPAEIILLDGATTIIGGNTFISGSYSKTKNKVDATAEGVYLAKIDENGKQNYLTYTPFADFKNFFTFLNAKSQSKMEKKIANKKEKGKEANISALVTMHDAMEVKDQIVLIGEVYYPTYRTESYTTTVNGQTTTQYRQVFDGYQYSHAFVVGYDQKGSKIWDNTFKMYLTYKPYTVKQFIQASSEGATVKLLFVSGEDIRSMSFTSGKISDDRTISPLSTGQDSDKIKSSFSNNTEYWYENNFISWGAQKIKNSDEKIGKKTRRVFFINKLAFK